MSQLFNILVILIIVLFIYYLLYFLKEQMFYFVLFNRGIINPDIKWWEINDQVFKKHTFSNYVNKYSHGNYNKNILGRNYIIVNKLDQVKEILFNSPNRYKRGNLKYNFFRTFMPDNIGVTYDTKIWRERRTLNEYILDTSIIHSSIIDTHKDEIKNIVKTIGQLHSRDDCVKLSHTITKLLLFGHTNVSDEIFDLIYTPTTIELIFKTGDHVKAIHNRWRYILKTTEIKDNSLIGKLKKNNNLDHDDIIDQIPHWVFPINGSISITLPRLLLLESLHSDNSSIRSKILETVRLYNPVVTLFRLDEQTGKEYLILIQMFLRNCEYFNNPHTYNPSRFENNKIEHELYCLMFSQGPQICPGKNLILYLLEILYEECKPYFKSNIKLDTNDLPDNLNPFKLF